jgi:hypothetical protein
MLLAGLFTLCTLAASADQILQGGVEEENYRLTHPNNGQALQGKAQDSMRITRTAPLKASAVDATAFTQAEKPVNAPNPLNAGVVDTGAFAQPPKNFDIGAERGSREMVLAWERWHHQLSGAIYSRWQEVAESKGHATIRVTVTKDRHISAEVLDLHGSHRFESQILEAINSLEGNPGLTFPAKSERQQVSFDADYIADTNVNPGYSWVKNDYEKVREGY